MKLKQGVKVQGVSVEILLALMLIQPLIDEYSVPMVVTSIRDGVHSINSKHKLGLAVDIRTRDLSEAEKVELFDNIKMALTNEYYVLLESDHIHIQFNGSFL